MKFLWSILFLTFAANTYCEHDPSMPPEMKEAIFRVFLHRRAWWQNYYEDLAKAAKRMPKSIFTKHPFFFGEWSTERPCINSKDIQKRIHAGLRFFEVESIRIEHIEKWLYIKGVGEWCGHLLSDLAFDDSIISPTLRTNEWNKFIRERKKIVARICALAIILEKHGPHLSPVEKNLLAAAQKSYYQIEGAHPEYEQWLLDAQQEFESFLNSNVFSKDDALLILRHEMIFFCVQILNVAPKSKYVS